MWGLTFDMSGGPKGAKRPLGRPLDGGVRPQRPAPLGFFWASEHDAGVHTEPRYMDTRTAALAAHASHTPTRTRSADSMTSPLTTFLRLKPSTKACAGNATSTIVPSMSHKLPMAAAPWKKGQISGHVKPEKIPASAAVTGVGSRFIAATDSARFDRWYDEATVRPPLRAAHDELRTSLLGPNVRHERQAKGREAAFGTSARWRG